MSHCFIERIILSGWQSQHNEPAPHSPPSSPPWMWLTAWSGRHTGKSLSYNMWEGPSDGAEGGQFIHSFPTPSGWRSTSYKISFPCFQATHLGRDAEVYSRAAGEGRPDGTCEKAELDPETGRVQGDPAESDPSHLPGLEKNMWFLQLLKAKSRTHLNISTIC